MQKAIFFISVFLVIIFLSFVRFGKGVKSEPFTNFFGINFTNANDGTPPELDSKNPTLPITQPYAPNLAELGVGNILPGPGSPSELPQAPYGNMSKAVPTPYKDPTVEPAKYIRILGVKEDLQAFFAFQAGSIEDSSDPSIQIPLTRSRADIGELVDLQSVLERNPGLPSRMTNKHLDDIQANLRYLQAITRDLEASGAISNVEGFHNRDEDTTDTTDTTPATLDQLKEFQTKVQAEILRLSANANTDPVIVARVNTLSRILADVKGTIEKIDSGFYTAATVPIYASDIERALPILGETSSPLPSILNKLNLPAAIANLFPGGLSAQNTEQAKQINNIVKGYMGQIFEGTSWGIDMKVSYDSPRAEKIYGQRHIDIGMPGFEEQQAQEGQEGQGQQYEGQRQGPWRQKLAKVINGLGDSSYSKGLPFLPSLPSLPSSDYDSDRILPTPVAGGLDWHDRSSQIIDQVKKRGLDPILFGALPADTEVSDAFNWKGYTSMFCSRLAANYDPGLPQSVGCPPANWPGWRESN